MSKILNEIEKETCVGLICKSKNSGDFIITKFNDNKNVEVKFLLSGYKTVKMLTHIKNGEVRDPYCPSIYGVGITGEKFPIHEKINSKERVYTPHYKIWTSMLSRCYNIDTHKRQPTYKDCTVSENFKHYEYFYKWCNNQVGFGNKGWCLDKDILIKGNKIYSEDTCVFLPRELNSLLVKADAIRGDFPIGVTCHKESGKFISSLSLGSAASKHLGLFKTPEEAFCAYKKAKEIYVKEKALKWKDKIDPRAFEALMNYKVDIND